MTKPFNIDLPQEFVDRIMVQQMLTDHAGVMRSLNQLKVKETLKDFEREDLECYNRWEESLRSALRYYMTKEEYTKIFGNKD